MNAEANRTNPPRVRKTALPPGGQSRFDARTAVRADMAKVIVERPRIACRAWDRPKGYQRQLQKHFPDGLPKREGMKRCWQGRTKQLNENLAPLRRYLDSQVGRPWDKVFSEICAHINRSSAVQDHVRDHIEDYVTVHVILIEGVPCSGEGGWHHGRPLHERYWRPWYVCPRTGLLRRIKVAARKPRAAAKKEEPPRSVRVSDTLQCRLVDGGWHLVTLKPLPLLPSDRVRCRDVDVLLNRRVSAITPAEAKKHYGAAVYAVAKRRLARRELRQYPVPVEWWG